MRRRFTDRSRISAIQIGVGLALAVLVGVALSPDRTDARKWVVQKDGSGDYTVIQDALNASAPGDTVWVGPGVYADYTDFQLDCCQSMPTYAGIAVRNLTLIGAHRDSVTIGPQSGGPIPNTTALGMRDGASGRFRVESLTLRNTDFGIRIMDSATVRDVRITNCWDGALAAPDSGVEIEDSLFDQCTNIAVAAVSGSRFVTVRGSRFQNNSSDANFTWSYEPRIENCVFETPGSVSITASGAGVRLVIENSYVDGGINTAIFADDSAELVLRRTEIVGLGQTALWVSSASLVDIQNCVLRGGSLATIWLASAHGDFAIQGNDIHRGTGQLVQLWAYPDWAGNPTFHFPNNYWGTTDPDSLDAWIYDSRADSTVFGTVDIYPIEMSSVPTQKQSVGGLKGAFRPRR